MAQWLVLQKFTGIGPVTSGSKTHRHIAGEVIDDTQVPVTALEASGLAVLPYVAATMDATIARFNEQFGSKDRDQGLAEMLLADGVGSGGSLTGIVNPNGVVTGLFGQKYHDTAAGIWYACDSNPSGTVWSVL